MLAVPHPRFRIDRLTDRAEKAKTGKVVLGRPLVAPLHEGAYGGRRGVKDRHAVSLADVPEAIALRPVGRAFVHHARRAVGEWTIHQVRVSGHPTDVRRAPEDVVVLEVEHHLRRRRHTSEVTAGGVDDSLRLASRARGVEDVEHVLCVHHFRVTFVGSFLHQIVPPEVAIILHRRVAR